jgi:glycosyltransferase involved in cell wall biosynthesis
MIIVGEGPEYNNLIKLFKANNVLEKVIFTGTLTKNALKQILPRADVFLYPAFHHGQATIVLQAMAIGLPVVCLECDAIGEMVSDNCGIKVRPEHPIQVVEDLAEALAQLAKNSNLCKRMGENAHSYVQEKYDWDRKGEKLNQMYELICSINHG